MVRIPPCCSHILLSMLTWCSDFPVSICKNTPIKLQKPDNKYDTILTVLDV